MAQVTRELPAAEWPRLAGTGLDAVWSLMHPESARVFVVEQDGEILGTWALIRMWHAEGCWVRPDHQKKAAVASALLTALKAAAEEESAWTILTASKNDATDVGPYLVRLGATPASLTLYDWPISPYNSTESPTCLPLPLSR